MQGLAFSPSAEQRKTVRAMSGFGIPQEDIATFLEIDAKTLRKHFRVELDRGSVEATAKVAQSLFRMATESNNVAAAIFWMKARAGWTDRQRIEHALAPYAVISGVPRADDLTDEMLMRIARGDYRAVEAEDVRGGARHHPRAAAHNFIINPPDDTITSEQWVADHAPPHLRAARPDDKG